jgi:hypothetical protein
MNKHDKAKEFVRKVLVDIFHQNPTEEELNRVALEVEATLPRACKLCGLALNEDEDTYHKTCGNFHIREA